MRARSKELVDRAIDAMVAAIGVYNLPNLPYRVESFAILAINAWELLLKAKWLADNGNCLKSLYVRKSGTKKRSRYDQTRSGTPKTHSIEWLARSMVEHKILDEAVQRNIEALVELRDGAVHFYHHVPVLVEQIQEVGIACVKNFVTIVWDWFGCDLSGFYIYPIPLSFDDPKGSLERVKLGKDEEKLLRYLNGLRSGHEDETARYSVAVRVELRFVRSGSSHAAAMRLSKEPDAVPIIFTDEQIRERYPWDYRELTQRCRERYGDFKVNEKYHRIRKSLEGDQRYAYVRYLDSSNPNSAKKVFYSQAILGVLDGWYSIKKR